MTLYVCLCVSMRERERVDKIIRMGGVGGGK